jgi:hypothetical protein
MIGAASAQEVILADIFPVSFDGRPYEGLYLLKKEQKISINPSTQHLSERISYEGPPTIVLYRDVRDAEGQWQPKEAVHFNIPGTGRYLAMFMGNEAQPRIQLIPFPEENFPSSTARFLNVTNENLFVRMGNQNLQLEASKVWSKALPYQDFLMREKQETIFTVEDGRSIQETFSYAVSSIPIVVGHRQQGRFTLVINAKVDLQRQARLSIILYAEEGANQGSTRYRMRILQEKVTP